MAEFFATDGIFGLINCSSIIIDIKRELVTYSRLFLNMPGEIKMLNVIFTIHQSLKVSHLPDAQQNIYCYIGLKSIYQRHHAATMTIDATTTPL